MSDAPSTRFPSRWADILARSLPVVAAPSFDERVAERTETAPVMVWCHPDAPAEKTAEEAGVLITDLGSDIRIHRLVYYSRNRGPIATEATIKQILEASRRNNARVGVTGALMFNAGCFAQVLEGPKAAVEHTFERIQQDERHGDVSVLAFCQVTKRAFDSWSMAFVGGSIHDSHRYGSVAGESGYDPSRMTGDALFETLQRLVLEEEGTHSAN